MGGREVEGEPARGVDEPGEAVGDPAPVALSLASLAALSLAMTPPSTILT